MSSASASLAAFVWSAVLATALAQPAPGQTTSPAFRPGPTLAEDLKDLKLDLVEGYARTRPRLLYGPRDLAAIRQKAQAAAPLWSRVLASAKRLGDQAPDEEEVKSGAHYWRIERAQSGALAYWVTGEKAHLDAAARWMVQYCKGPLWGVGWGQNVDLHASWYLYHISLAYDTLYDDLAEADRKVIREGLASHAQAVYESLNPAHASFRYKDGFRYDQNHTYIPAVGLAAASLALLGEEPRAVEWLKEACAILRRCRYALGEDGYYYEGTGYWVYALHWHVRYADLISRATGQEAHDLPILRENWRMALQLGLPGTPYLYGVGDVGRGSKDGNRAPASVNQHGIFWDLATRLRSGPCRLAGDLLETRWPEEDYPASAFLWFDPSVAPARLEDIRPYHHFADHGLVAWRSGWEASAACYLFRCGPPAAHSAAAKLKEMKDWLMNCGHVHPDIGAFWMYAKGAYLATDTGYTANKFTRDHNTLTIDGVGQAMDGEYHNERGYPYERFDRCRIDRMHFQADYGFASGEFGPAYPAQKVGEVSLRRSVLMTPGWLLVVDDLQAPQPRKLTWYCHSDWEFKKDGEAFAARGPKAALAVVPVQCPPMEDHPEKTEVMAGTSPGEGKPEVRGWHLRREMKSPAAKTRLAHLLVPLGTAEAVPTVSQKDTAETQVTFILRWADGKQQSATLDLAWKPDPARPEAGPAVLPPPQKPQTQQEP